MDNVCVVGPGDCVQGSADNVVNDLLARATVATDDRVVNAERAAGAGTHLGADGQHEDALLDAVLLADGNVITSDLHSVRSVVDSIRTQLRNKDNVVVPRGSETMNEFTASDLLLHRSFPCLFIFGIGINGVAGVSEPDTRHLLFQAFPAATYLFLFAEHSQRGQPSSVASSIAKRLRPLGLPTCVRRCWLFHYLPLLPRYSQPLF